ncbi:DNA recombination protein RmuC [Paeniroseomonas aquatica]|uniref:DNA recombination protein RmuC homolog n=1 Tax=Paeniroseomonas aquatica TaxID=373043 RepID=A0ABT8ADA6_9PROT|nr:DNA recombination protein RmuC [Paeniroseomonas aquatica]MDN3567536.1 DNA recombination protein RmuC [Paeniroseomonas aquatica]
MPEWILPVLVPVAAALAGMLVVLAFRPRGNDGVALLADRMDALSQRLDGAVAAQNERLARSLAESADRTQDSARRIHERLAVIDAARANIEALGTQVTTLSGILGNKQSRGAFGEVQLRDMLADRLPADGWAWQYTLASGVRCDALIRLPFPPGPIAIDSKFPLEAWQALRAAPDDAARALAQRRLATDIRRHVDDVATKYIRPGETAEGALIFLPSEALHADLHAVHGGLVQEAARRGVYLVSPGTLWAVLGAMRALMRDVRLRAEAQHLRLEVSRLAEETGRLDRRVANLKRHFAEMQQDVQQIEITAQKITAAGARIEAVEMDPPSPMKAAAQ